MSRTGKGKVIEFEVVVQEEARMRGDRERNGEGKLSVMGSNFVFIKQAG